MKKKICFVINPFSGVKKKKELERLIPKKLDLSQFDYEIVYTHGPHHATTLTKDAIDHGFDYIAAVGGDGTVNEVGKGLIDSDATMCIIPMGSGNGLARHLGISMNEKKAIEQINRSKEKVIDTVRINDSIYLGVAGIGFDAHIARKFASMKKRGVLRYIQIVFQEFLKYTPKEYDLLIDGQPHHKKAFLVSFANSSQYGNNIIIAPQAHINDGSLEVVVINPFSLFRLFKLALRLFFQTIDKSPYVNTFKAKEIVVKGKNLQAHIDGESVSFTDGLKINIHPKSLKILVP